MLTKDGELHALEQKIRDLQRSPADVSELARGVPPFSYDDWKRTAPPATQEELEDWEEFLRWRESERESNLAREAGLAS